MKWRVAVVIPITSWFVWEVLVKLNFLQPLLNFDELESHNQSIDDHLSTETEEDMYADIVEQTYNDDDFKTTSSSSSSHGDQESITFTLMILFPVNKHMTR